MLNKQKIALYKTLGLLNENNLETILYCFKPEAIDNICECVYNSIYNDLHFPQCKIKKIKKLLKNKKAQKNIKIITNKSADSKSKLKALSKEKKGLKAILTAVNSILPSN